MDNNTEKRPQRKRVTKKMLRQRQFCALAVISFIILLFIILIFKGCSGTDKEKNSKKEPTLTTTSALVTTTVPETTVTTTTANPLASQVVLSKREIFLQNIGDTDISIISAYPEGSAEVNEVWTSLDESIATVDGYGHITAVGPGETYVILSFDNNPTIEIEIKVHVAEGLGAVGAESNINSDAFSNTPETVFTTPVDSVDGGNYLT